MLCPALWVRRIDLGDTSEAPEYYPHVVLVSSHSQVTPVTPVPPVIPVIVIDPSCLEVLAFQCRKLQA